MTNKEAFDIFEDNFTVLNSHGHYTEEEENQAMAMAMIALELLDTLKDRPCSVCRHHKERTEFEVGGCCKWDCVFDGHIDYTRYEE